MAQICLFMLMWVLSNMMVHLPVDNQNELEWKEKSK